jgi:hypothetical protein
MVVPCLSFPFSLIMDGQIVLGEIGLFSLGVFVNDYMNFGDCFDSVFYRL